MWFPLFFFKLDFLFAHRAPSLTRVEGTMATPDPPLDKTTKAVPCPAHRKGHPTFVDTQLAPVSPPFASQRHQNLSPLSGSHTLSSRQANQTGSSDSSEDQERQLMDKQTAQPPNVTHTPRDTSLFHLPGMLNGFEYVAPGDYVSKGVI
jgi:hypothetical protein